MSDKYKCTVSVFLILTRDRNGKKEILLQERCNTGYMDGKYDMACSGHLEPNESLSQAVVREAKEEIGIDIEEKDLKLAAVIHPVEEEYVNMFFTTQKYKGQPEIMEPNQCSKLDWFDINNLPDNTWEKIKNVVMNMQKGILYDDGKFSNQKLMEDELERNEKEKILLENRLHI